MSALSLLFLVFWSSAGPMQAVDASDHAAVSTQEWVIVMHDPRSARRRSRVGGVGYAAGPSYASDPRLMRAASQLAEDFALSVVDQWPIKSLSVHCVVATLPIDQGAEAVVAALKADSRVSSVQKMNAFESLGTPDPYRELQPALRQLGVDDIRDYATGAGVSISIVDSGVDADHPDLAGVVELQENFIDGSVMRGEHHGTGVAGVIAARTNNGAGVAGVAPDAKVQSLRACWQNEGQPAKAYCNTLTLSRALDRVIDIKPPLLNLSLTGPRDPLLEELLSMVIAQKTIVVAAYDESRGDQRRFPRARAGVFYGRSGGAETQPQRTRYLPAPGDDVLTVQPRGKYDVLSGNSLSAAHLSGAIALVLERFPKISPEQLADALSASVAEKDGKRSISACRALRTLDAPVTCAL